MRVLTYVSRFVGDTVPGLEAQIYEEYLRLSQKIKLVVITEDASYNKINENLLIVKVRRIQIPKLRALFKIINYVISTIKQKNQYHIVYIRTFSPPELISGIIAKRILKKSLIVLIPGSWMFMGNSFKTRVFKKIYHNAINSADKIIIYSNLMSNEIEELIGKIDHSKIVIIRNAVDILKFKPTNNHDGTLLYVGRINPLKGIEHIIKALPQIIKSYPKVKLNIVGLIESETYFRYLQKLATELKCINSVNFIGPIPHDKITSYYDDAEIFVFMGKNEGIPRSMLEAMACGKPIIAAPNSGIPDVIEDGVNGFLINYDTNKIASKIIELLNDKTYCDRIGVNARKTIENRFRWDIFIEQLLDLFKKF